MWPDNRGIDQGASAPFLFIAIGRNGWRQHGDFELHTMRQQHLQILLVLFGRYVAQQLGQLVADRGQALIEQFGVALTAAQAPALVGKFQLQPVGRQSAGFELAFVQQAQFKQLQQGVIGQAIFAKAKA